MPKRDDSTAVCASCAIIEARHRFRVAPCGHVFCVVCLKRMARLALKDRALVPLRCCQKELPIDYVRDALASHPGDYDAYQRFLRERDWKYSDLASDAEYAGVVQRVGAKQCPGCGIGVQRDFGCVHMTCPNGHQFCFTCLRVWQTCACPLIPLQEQMQILGPE